MDNKKKTCKQSFTGFNSLLFALGGLKLEGQIPHLFMRLQSQQLQNQQLRCQRLQSQ
ncbi:hypothetical protein IMSAGC014_01212 [Bacteroidaceae bacterium]|nr:hypothetical protein IMSAGC014_01212 [Bacteroidaceae bacterium]